MWGDAAQRGNAQDYCGGDPVNAVDRFDLDTIVDMFKGMFRGIMKGIEGDAEAIEALQAYLDGKIAWALRWSPTRSP